MMVVLPTLHQPRKQLHRCVLAFPPSRAIPWWPLLVYSEVLTSISPPSSTIHYLQIVENFENKSESGSSPSDDEDVILREANKGAPEPLDYSYSERDVIVYNLSIGATEQELQWVFESDREFAALPAFGVIPQFLASAGLPLDFLPNYNAVRNSRTFGLRIGHRVVPMFTSVY